MVDLTFRTVGAWGAGKGANLVPAEVDSNFWSLAQAIFDLQASPAIPVGIASITVSGTQMTIHLTDGTVLGPYTLPVLTMRWRGEWQPSTIYAELDVVSDAATGIYMVQIAHTSGATFDPNMLIGGNPVFLQLFGIISLETESVGNVVAIGADQAGAAALSFQQNYVTGATAIAMVAAGTGVRIAPSQMIVGHRISVTNEHATNWLLVYPVVGGQINSRAINASISVPPDSTAIFQVRTAGLVRSIP